MRSTWLIYALGGGMGHLCRSIALARRAIRHGVQVKIISNSPFAAVLTQNTFPRLIPSEPQIEIIALPATAGKHEIAVQVAEIFERWLVPVDHPLHRPSAVADTASKVLIVDTFPRGLAGELPALLDQFTGLKVLVHRDLNPEYVRWADLEDFVRRYDVILSPGESGPLAELNNAVRTDPWLVCDQSELLPRAAARHQLLVPEESSLPLCLVMGNGKPDEAAAAAQAAVRLDRELSGRAVVRLVSCDLAALKIAANLGVTFWPALAVLPGVDLLVGSGGYNTVHEARSTRTLLIAVAQSRLYDRQKARLNPAERAENWEEAVALAHRFFANAGQRTAEADALGMGAENAVNVILQRIHWGGTP